MNTYSEETKDFRKTPLIETLTIKGEDVHWPVYTEPYGLIVCNKISLKAPLYMGDSDYILSGKIKQKVENDYDEDYDEDYEDEE